MAKAVFIFALMLLCCVGSAGPLDGLVICLDPGHGGQEKDSEYYMPGVYTGGAFGAATKQTEGDVNLRVANKLSEILRVAGAQIVLTRQHRGRIMNRDCEAREEIEMRSKIAAMYSADIFISIHHNDAGRKRDVNYTTAFYGKQGDRPELLAKGIVQAISKEFGTRILPVSHGDQYRLIRSAEKLMPGCLTVLVEASFMSNREEDRKLAGEKRTEQEAIGIYNGIVNYQIGLKWHKELGGMCRKIMDSLQSGVTVLRLKRAMSTITKIFTQLASAHPNSKAQGSK